MNPLSGVATLNTAASSRVVQLSDTHLMRESGGQLMGIDTDRSLAAVCRLVANQGPIDALLLTGDLAGDEAEEAYGRLSELLKPLAVPSFWLPGNHDAVWSDNHPLRSHFKRSIHLPHWDVLMLNTQHPGAVAGHLPTTEMQALEAAVQHAEVSGRPLLVATHHPLMPVGCEWLDQIGVELDGRGNVAIDANRMSSVPGVFVAGDAARGQSLVVWAISEGRETARAMDLFLMGETSLPHSLPEHG